MLWEKVLHSVSLCLNLSIILQGVTIPLGVLLRLRLRANLPSHSLLGPTVYWSVQSQVNDPSVLVQTPLVASHVDVPAVHSSTSIHVVLSAGFSSYPGLHVHVSTPFSLIHPSWHGLLSLQATYKIASTNV